MESPESTEDFQTHPSLPEHPVYVPPELSDKESFHVFISSSSTDHTWSHSLIEQLEDRGLRVCYHERDFTPGRPILENMSESIHQSQKVLLVLSQEFVKSRWCLLEANMSMFRDCLQRKPIVPVLLQPEITIPLHLSHLTYLEVRHPDFTNQLLKVLCTPNHQLKNSTVAPYHHPTIYNGKVFQPLIAINEHKLSKTDCGVWSDMVPGELRFIIQDSELYREAIGIINTVHQQKLGLHQPMIVPVVGLLLSLVALVVYTLTHSSTVLQKVDLICSLVFWVTLAWLSYIVVDNHFKSKRIIKELQKAIGKANTLLYQENILTGYWTTSKIYTVYVSLDDCRRVLTEQYSKHKKGEDMFQKALLDFSSKYTRWLAQMNFPFETPTRSGHLHGSVCFCQYVLHELKSVKQRSDES